MTNLSIGFALIIIVTGVLIFSPLFKRSRVSANRDALNKQIFREHVKELEGAGGGQEAAYVEKLTADLEKTLIADVPLSSSGIVADDGRASLFSRVLLGVCMLLLPVMALWLYSATGNYQKVMDWVSLKEDISGGGANYTDLNDEEAQARLETKTVAEVVAVLQASLQQDQETVEGWQMLASAFARTENFESALYAIKRGLDLDSKDVGSLLTYAQVLIASNQGKLTRESKNILDQVFLQEPNNATALSLLGMSYFNSGAYPAAIKSWERLLEVGGGNASMAAIIERSIAVAKERLAQPQGEVLSNPLAVNNNDGVDGVIEGSAVDSRGLDLRVGISSELEALLAPSDTLFVFAKAVSGPPMPLAVFRSTLGGFPVDVHLDDSMAMMPQLKLSKYKQVNVVARISKHGSVSAQAGDLEGRIELIEPGANDLFELVIDRVIP